MPAQAGVSYRCRPDDLESARLHALLAKRRCDQTLSQINRMVKSVCLKLQRDVWDVFDPSSCPPSDAHTDYRF